MNKTNYLKLQRLFTQTGGGLVKVVYLTHEINIDIDTKDTVHTAIQKIKTAFDIENNSLHTFSWTCDKKEITNDTIISLDGKTTYFVTHIISLTTHRTNTFMQCLGGKDSKHSDLNLGLYEQYMQIYDNYKLANMTEQEKKDKLFPCLSELRIYSEPRQIPTSVIDAVFNPSFVSVRTNVLETKIQEQQQKIINCVTTCVDKFFLNPPPSNVEEIKIVINNMKSVLQHMDPLFMTIIYNKINKDITEYESTLPFQMAERKTLLITKLTFMTNLNSVIAPHIIHDMPLSTTYNYEHFYRMCKRMIFILKKIFGH